jgi:hypothetical protein
MDDKARQHRAAKAWLDAALSGSEQVGFAWMTLLGFLRISTQARLFLRPLSVAEASRIVEMQLSSPVAEILQPGPDHARILLRLLAEAGTAGNLVPDAHLAALAIEHGAELVTFDRDFGRFKGLRWKLLQVS